MLKEFREFAVKGNVVDLAIGVIIGAAFGKIVESIVKDIFMPIVGRILGGLNFDNYFFGLTEAASKATNYADAQKAGATLGYGAFITVTINFLIIAWILFLVVKGINRMKAKAAADAAATPPAPPPEVPADVKLLTEIRDLLKKP